MEIRHQKYNCICKCPVLYFSHCDRHHAGQCAGGLADKNIRQYNGDLDTNITERVVVKLALHTGLA